MHKSFNFVLSLFVLALFVIFSCADSGNTDGEDTPETPAVPGDFTATVVSSSQINLSWTDASNGKSRFVIERSTDGISYSEITVTIENTTSYEDEGLQSNTVYYYRIQAFQNSEYSDFTSGLQCITFARLSDIHYLIYTPVQSSPGDEVSGTSADGSGYTITILGTSFALPGDPWAPPTIPAVPPENIYGCINNVSLVITPSENTIEFEFTIPVLFIDIETYSVVTSTDDGYCVITDLVFTSTTDLSTLPDGRKQIGSSFTSEIGYSDFDLQSEASVVEFVGSTILSFFAPLFLDQCEEMFKDILELGLAELSAYDPE